MTSIGRGSAGRGPARLARILPAGSFIRGAAVLVSGTALGQGLVILSSPLLTRLYTPDDFGVLGVYAAALAIVTLIASLRYELAIPLPDSDVQGASVLGLSAGLVLGMTGLTAVGIALAGDWLIDVSNTPAFGGFLWLVPVGVLVGGLHKAGTFWALRKKALGLLARVRMAQGAGMVGAQIAMGVAGVGPLGLVLGHLLGYGTGLAGLVRYAWTSGGTALRHVRRQGVGRAARRYRRFPMFSTWSDVANVGGTQLPLVLFAGMFSPAVAGLYMLAHRVASAPAALVSEAMGKAFMASAVEARRLDSLTVLAERFFRLLIRLGTGPLLIVAMVAPELFAVVFGAEWVDSGRYLQLIAPWLASVFVVAPLTTLFAVLEQQHLDFLFQVTLLVTRVGGLLLGAFLGGPMLAVALYAAAATAVYGVFGVALLSRAGVTVRVVAGALVGEAVALAPVGALLWVGRGLLDGHSPGLLDGRTLALAAIPAACGAYVVVRLRPAIRDLSCLRPGSGEDRAGAPASDAP